MRPRYRAVLALCIALAGPAAVRAADPAPPSLLIATPTFLMFAEGDRRQAAVAGAGSGSYRPIGLLADGSALVAYDDGLYTVVETISRALEARKVRTFTRGTQVYPGTGGFLTYEGSSQLVRRYDTRGSLQGQPLVTLGATEILAVGETIVSLGNGRLRVWDKNGRLHRESILDGNSLVQLPAARFAVNDTRDGEVRAYTLDLEQVATLRYVGLPVRLLASAPDGALAVLAGTPACTLSNAEVDVFTDLHAQPIARIHDGITVPVALAVGPDYVYIANRSCSANGDDGTISVFARDGTPKPTMRNIGTPTAILPFKRT